MADWRKRLSELASRGGSAAQVAAALKGEGFKTSRATVGRELRKLRGTQRVGRRSTKPHVGADTPDGTGDETPEPKTLDGLLEVAGRALQLAETKGDLAALARFGTLATSILEAKRKAAPPDVMPDGSFVSSDEMKALADKAEARLLALVADENDTSDSKAGQLAREIRALVNDELKKGTR